MTVESCSFAVRDSVIFVAGELDVASKDKFEKWCMEASREAGNVVIVDLSGLTFIDASGIGAVLGFARFLQDEERFLVLRSARSFVRRVFDITGLTFLLERTWPLGVVKKDEGCFRESSVEVLNQPSPQGQILNILDRGGLAGGEGRLDARTA